HGSYTQPTKKRLFARDFQFIWQKCHTEVRQKKAQKPLCAKVLPPRPPINVGRSATGWLGWYCGGLDECGRRQAGTGEWLGGRSASGCRFLGIVTPCAPGGADASDRTFAGIITSKACIQASWNRDYRDRLQDSAKRCQ